MSRSIADLLFRPRSVVVYGASSEPEKLSGRPLAYLKKFGYRGDLYAINPHRENVQGIPAYDDIAAVPGPIDLAVVVVPAASVLDALRRCAEAGVGAAVVFASGFAEIGGEGRAAEEEIDAIVQRTGMRVLGPNCLGSFSLAERAFVTFSTAFDEEGELPDSPIALVSQSGAVGTFTYSTMTALGLGVRYFANPGNSTDISVVELLTALAGEPDVAVLLGHIEGFEDAAALEQLAGVAHERGKPLVVLKAGRTAAGSRAVGAHTASTPGDDEAFDRVLREHGAVRVQSMESLADTALAFAAGRRARGRRLTIVTSSGGAGALITDAAVERGLIVEPWESADRDRLTALLPYFGSTANPIDLTGAMITDVGIFVRALEVIISNEETDAVLLVVGNADSVADEIVVAVEAGYATTTKPLIVAWTGGSGRPRDKLLAAGVPTYPDPLRAVRVIGHIVDYGMRAAMSGAL